MKNGKTTLIGLIVAVILAAWGVFQPALTGGDVDLKVLIPAAVIAVVAVLQKDTGNWKTTFVGILLAALAAGASAYQAEPNQWIFVIGAVLSAIGGSLTKDHDQDTSTTIKV